MPIEIRITDVRDLTERSVNELFKYLSAMRKQSVQDYLNEHAEPPVEDITVTQEVDLDIEELSATLLQEKKTRKKRTAAVRPDKQRTMFSEEEISKAFPEENDLPPPPPFFPEIEYDDLMAYISDGISYKKMTYQTVLDVLSTFNVPNLEALEQVPEMIMPFYRALKEKVYG
jgi:hypothetical protein